MKKYILFTVIYFAYALNGTAQINDKTFGFSFTQDSITQQYKILQTVKGGPAEKAKLAKGDILLTINYKDLKNYDLNEVGQIFKDAKDESFIGILRNNKEQAVNITKTDRIKLYNNAATYKTFTLPNGDKYQGYAVNEDILHGKGKYTSKYGVIYEGNFVINLLEGEGKIVHNSGAIYEGNCKNTRMDGIGKFTFNGDVYTGEFKDDYKEGKGKMMYANGNIYDGDWKENKIEGKGKYTFISGNIYEGDWKNNKWEGKGKFLFNNGDVYDGDWKNDKQDGNGKYIHKNGDEKNGIWIQGNEEGEFKWYSKTTNTTKTLLYKNGQVVQNEVITGSSSYDNNGSYVAPTIVDKNNNTDNDNTNIEDEKEKKKQRDVINKLETDIAIEDYNKQIAKYNKSMAVRNKWALEGRNNLFYTRPKMIKALEACVSYLDEIERGKYYYALPQRLKNEIFNSRNTAVKQMNEISSW